MGEFHKQFHVPKEDISIVALSPDQLHRLIYDQDIEYKLPDDLKVIKDIFVFGCTVALRFSDLADLRPFNWRVDHGNHYLEVVSQKTGTATRIKLPDYAVVILKKYKRKCKTLLPMCSNAYFNKQLKVLVQHVLDTEAPTKTRTRRGRQVALKKMEGQSQIYRFADHITSHTMRRTGITNLLRMGVPEHVVRKISGHSAQSKEFHKYVSFSQKYLDEEIEKTYDRSIKRFVACHSGKASITKVIF